MPGENVRGIDYALFHAVKEGRIRSRFDGKILDSAAADALCSRNWGPNLWTLPPDIELSVDDTVEEFSDGDSQIRAPVIVMSHAEIETLLQAKDKQQSVGRRGRKPKFDWDAIDAEAARLFEHHGTFQLADKDWNVQARLEEGIIEFCEKKYGEAPAISSVRKRASHWIDTYNKRF